MNLTYNAKDPQEFKDLCFWLRDNGFYKNGGTARVAESKDGETWESKYLELSGQSRMRLNSLEQVNIQKGLKTREDIAKDRYEALMRERGGAAPILPDVEDEGASNKDML